MPRFSNYLSETFDVDEFAEIKKGGSDLVKLVMADFDTFIIYTSSSKRGGAPIFAYKKNKKDDHFTLLYFKQAVVKR